VTSEQFLKSAQAALKGFKYERIEVFLEEDDVFLIEIISDEFKGVSLNNRINMMISKFMRLSMSIGDYQIVYGPLTVNEKDSGISESKL